MKKAFHFTDDKSNKFWWIANAGDELVINYGKADTTGRFQIKDFSSEVECVKEAEKLIAQKIKKGYKEDTQFDFYDRFYFDDEEYGLHPLTSHPYFREHFVDEFYYDCTDEEAPFGSDEGADTLYDMQDVVRKKGLIDFDAYPQSLIEKVWDMKYISVTEQELNEESVKKIVEIDEMNRIQSDMVTYASAFAQIKITGFVNKSLKERAILAMKRIAIAAKLQGYDSTEIGQTMIKDLSSFDKIQQ